MWDSYVLRNNYITIFLNCSYRLEERCIEIFSALEVSFNWPRKASETPKYEATSTLNKMQKATVVS